MAVSLPTSATTDFVTYPDGAHVFRSHLRIGGYLLERIAAHRRFGALAETLRRE